MRAPFLPRLVLALAMVATPWGASSQAQTGSDGLALSLGYDGRLFMLTVLDIEVRAQASAHAFSASSRLTSAGILAAFKHVDERAASSGRIVDATPQPGLFDYQNLGGKTHRRVRAAWTGLDVDTTADPPFPNLGDPPASREQRRTATDPLTALMRMTLDGSRETVCHESDLFFDGKQLYALDFFNPRSTQPTETQARLGLVNPFRCDIRFREVAGFRRKPPDQRNQGLRRPIIVDFAQVGSDGPWVIASLRAQTPLGWAVIELERLSVSGRPTP